jgi:hypothetical protein
MNSQDGPPLEALTRHLADCPAEFLTEPRLGRTGVVEMAAVAADLLQNLGISPSASDLAAFTSVGKEDRGRLRLALLGCWLFHYPWFAGHVSGQMVLEILSGGLDELAGLAPAETFVQDPDRREELARFCLNALGLRPAGETEAQAQDRLATLNSAERRRVVAAARSAESRAGEIRRKMAEEAARRAESKAMPE